MAPISLQSLSLLFICVVLVHQAQAVLVNRTIDDTAGDPITGFLPKYLPTTAGIWEDATCAGCRVKADRNLAFKHSWTSATFQPELGQVSIEMNFTGTAIYVFFILANKVVAPFITTETACNFTLDGKLAGDFQHTPSESTEFIYNASVFTSTNLSNTDHHLLVSTSGLDRHVFLSFDYAIYTVDEPASPTSTPTEHPGTSPTEPPLSTTQNAKHSKVPIVPIAAGLSGGLVVLLTILVAICLLRRRRRPRQSTHIAGEKNCVKHRPSFSVPFTIDEDPYYNNLISRDMNNQPKTIAISGEIRLTPQRVRQQDNVPASARTNRRAMLSTSTGTASREELRRIRQAEIDRQLRELVREMRELNKDRKLDSGIGVDGDDLESARPRQTRREEQEMAEMRAQMQAMREQILYLEAQQHSEWAQGVSDDPPPGYSPRSRIHSLRTGG